MFIKERGVPFHSEISAKKVVCKKGGLEKGCLFIFVLDYPLVLQYDLRMKREVCLYYFWTTLFFRNMISEQREWKKGVL